MPVNNPQEMFVLLLSDVRRKTERSIEFYREAGKIAEDPDIKEAIESRAFVAEKSLEKIDEAFKLIKQKPVTLSGRTEEVFVEDFRREVAEIKSPVVRRIFVLSKLMSCHNEVKPDFNKPFHHKVLEGVMKCSDCHNPHGGFELKQARLATGVDAACIKCHADKQGPFTYEHAPIKTDGCPSCHTPHGSANPRLLKYARVNQLCLTCHSVDHGVGADEPAGPTHNQNAQYASCTNCHVKIHDHPAFAERLDGASGS